MALIIEKPAVAFDLTQISRGTLLWGKHQSWTEGKAGFITAATQEQVTIQYYPGIGNVTNHFIIPVAEVVAEQWEIRWSSDLVQVQQYGNETEEEP